MRPRVSLSSDSAHSNSLVLAQDLCDYLEATYAIQKQAEAKRALFRRGLDLILSRYSAPLDSFPQLLEDVHKLISDS